MTYLVVMPFTHLGYASECLASMAPEVWHHTLTVDNTVDNKGAAGSYNIGARQVLDEGLDWLITLSPSTRFGPEGGSDMIEYLHGDGKDAWVVEADMPVGWHWIAWHRRMFERIGIWDENFWPVYGEDIDISHRILTAIDEDKADRAWQVFPCDAWMMMQGYSAHVGGVDVRITAETWSYYEAKWGGRSGHEKFNRPFDDPENGLDYWVPGSVTH